MPVSNIDELLMGGGGNTQQADTPEFKDLAQEVDYEPQPEHDENEIEEEQEDYGDEEHTGEQEDDEQADEEPQQKTKKAKVEYDEYGNEQEPENEAIRERLARQARKHESEIAALRAQLAEQGASREVQQAAKDFEYDPEASGDWQQQLRQFVKQTINEVSTEKSRAQQQAQEQHAQQEFESKFREGMNKFDDFVDVMTGLPFEISDAMTLATRGMTNPAAFLYAAAKRNPQELERISKIRDPYAQMTEIGKLEERMRKSKPSTKAPRPLSRTVEDSTVRTPKKQKQPNGDDLLARADAKRLANVKQRLTRNR